jgi:putative flippase GtrA
MSLTATATATATATPTLDLVVPVLDESDVLEDSVRQLVDHLERQLPFTWRITIVDNGSTDGTDRIAEELVRSDDRIRFLRLERRGRGGALRAAWSSSDADVVAYTDVDLSTGLDALLPMVAPLVTGHSDVAIGSRLSPGAAVARGPRREAISRSYNLLLRSCFATRFHDAQCGFKAVRRDAAATLLPAVQDDAWFFDTELLLLAEHNGLRVHEVPVDWVDDPDSSVDVVRTAVADLSGMARMALRFARGGGIVDTASMPSHGVEDDMGRRLVSFVVIGGVSTAVSSVVFLGVTPFVGALGASWLALSVTAVANTWAHRRYTFARRGPGHRRRDATASGVLLGAGLAASTAAVLAVQRLGGGTGAVLASLVAVWSLLSVARYRMLRPERVLDV